ncbi:MAG: T9SS type A sorting domain-containing protein [Bacteroidota bacterium]|jgi:hypothetical protein
MKDICSSIVRLSVAFLFLTTGSLFSQTGSFDYKRYLFGTPTTMLVFVESVNTTTGNVSVNGGDSQAPTTPFTWNWGDGKVTSGFFPQVHTYANTAKNYVLTVTANYSSGRKDSAKTVVRFIAPNITPIALPSDVAVRIPSSPVTLGTRLYVAPQLAAFDDRFFTTLPRSTLEYVLSVASYIEKDLVNGNVFLFNSKFEQVMLRDSSFGGAYSLWFTNPVAFGVSDVYITGPIGYSSLFHEMGHNYTLNMPAAYYYGGRIDGNANAIYSETLAQIFQHAAGYEIVNHAQAYGLSDDLVLDIQQSLNSSIGIIRSSYQDYLNGGMRFTSWNDPTTTVDETVSTFMTIAYKFCEQAENTGQGYRIPVKRMTNLLQGFNPTWWQWFDQAHNTAAADTFRATLFATAISYAFAKDLRSDFRALNFPISDQIYTSIYNSTVTSTGEQQGMPLEFRLDQNYPNPFNPSTTIRYDLPKSATVSLNIYNTLGQVVTTLVNEHKEPGSYQVQWNVSSVPSGIYFYRLQAGEFVEAKKAILLK